MAQAVATCDSDTVADSASPNGSWIAVVQEDTCTDGAFVTNISDVVHLLKGREKPTKENSVFSLDEHGHPENRPLLDWLSSGELLITIPNKSLVGLQRDKYRDVMILIKYNPPIPLSENAFLSSSAFLHGNVSEETLIIQHTH